MKFKWFIFIAVFAMPYMASASCDIQPIAQSYFKEMNAYSTFGLPIPKLVISNAPLVKIDSEKIKEYGKPTSKTRGVMASQFDSDIKTITIYSQVFADHEKCDAFAYNKTKRYLVHEYTHYLDFNYPLSEAVHANNLETTAIMGENILPKLVWGRRNPMVIRPLTKKEKHHSAILRRFFIEHKGQH